MRKRTRPRRDRCRGVEPDPAVPGLDRPLPEPGPGAGGGARRGLAGPDARRPGAGRRWPASPRSRPRGGPGWPPARSRACWRPTTASASWSPPTCEPRSPTWPARWTRGRRPSAADPVDLAAVAYLIRPDGWAGSWPSAGDGRWPRTPAPPTVGRPGGARPAPPPGGDGYREPQGEPRPAPRAGGRPSRRRTPTCGTSWGTRAPAHAPPRRRPLTP